MNMFNHLAKFQFNWRIGNYEPTEVALFFACLSFVVSSLFSQSNPYAPAEHRFNSILISSLMVGAAAGAITYYNNNMFNARKKVYMEQGLDESEAIQEALADARQESILQMLQ